MAHPYFRLRLGTTPRILQLSSRLRTRQGFRRFLQDDAKQHGSRSSKQPDPETANPHPSIPGPSWFWQPLAAPFLAYGRVSARRPYVTQVISSLIVYTFGDLAVQYIQQRVENPANAGKALVENYSYQRSLRAMAIGCISSIPSYHWFIFLSTHFNVRRSIPYSHVLSLAYKITISQIFFAPMFNSYFFGMQSLLSGDGGPSNLPGDASVWDTLALKDRFAAAGQRIYLTVPTSWINSCYFWPGVTAFSFTFVPMRQRSIFAGVVAIGWQCYLGLLNQRAAAQESGEVAVEA